MVKFGICFSCVYNIMSQVYRFLFEVFNKLNFYFSIYSSFNDVGEIRNCGRMDLPRY